jgi:hypothetical protein
MSSASVIDVYATSLAPFVGPKLGSQDHVSRTNTRPTWTRPIFIKKKGAGIWTFDPLMRKWRLSYRPWLVGVARLRTVASTVSAPARDERRDGQRNRSSSAPRRTFRSGTTNPATAAANPASRCSTSFTYQDEMNRLARTWPPVLRPDREPPSQALEPPLPRSGQTPAQTAAYVPATGAR